MLFGILSLTPVSDLRGGKGGFLGDRREADDSLWFREIREDRSLSCMGSDTASLDEGGSGYDDGTAAGVLGGTGGAFFVGGDAFRLIR